MPFSEFPLEAEESVPPVQGPSVQPREKLSDPGEAAPCWIAGFTLDQILLDCTFPSAIL